MMNGMMVFRPDLELPELAAECPAPTLRDLQALVGGYIELVGRGGYVGDNAVRTPVQVYGNEEGKLTGLPVNVAATAWLARHHPSSQAHRRAYQEHRDWIVGPMVVLLGNALLD